MPCSWAPASRRPYGAFSLLASVYAAWNAGCGAISIRCPRASAKMKLPLKVAARAAAAAVRHGEFRIDRFNYFAGRIERAQIENAFRDGAGCTFDIYPQACACKSCILWRNAEQTFRQPLENPKISRLGRPSSSNSTTGKSPAASATIKIQTSAAAPKRKVIKLVIMKAIPQRRAWMVVRALRASTLKGPCQVFTTGSP